MVCTYVCVGEGGGLTYVLVTVPWSTAGFAAAVECGVLIALFERLVGVQNEEESGFHCHRGVVAETPFLDPVSSRGPQRS